MNNTGKVVANEIDKIRFERLRHNVEHLGCKNVELVNGDAKKL
jgi:16S rRNA C967 or C1407 C5-methylase (RsmB/RsmF family)